MTFKVFPMISLLELKHWGVANLDTEDHCWQDLCRIPLDIPTYQIKAVGLIVLKKIFLFFLHY